MASKNRKSVNTLNLLVRRICCREAAEVLQVTAILRYILISFMVVVPAALAISAGAGTAGTQEAEGCPCLDRVGNVDCDYADVVSIEDLQLLADHLFYDYSRLPSREEANCSGDSAGMIDIVDLQVLIDHMFGSFEALPECPGPPNSPPDTRILGQHGELFVNAVAPESLGTGIVIQWVGTDLVDHPYYPPPIGFEWRLYGPYEDSIFERLRDSFFVPVFIANDNRVFRFGLPPDTVWDTIIVGPDVEIIPREVPTSMIVCDTSYVNGYRIVTCDTMLIDTMRYDNEHGRLDSLFDIDSPAFTSKEVNFDRVAAESFNGTDGWVYDTIDTIYNVYARQPMDTTAQMNFVFWIRSRDPVDSSLYDLVPDFQAISVINAMRERDVLVIDMGIPEEINESIADSARGFWTNAINTWRPAAAQGASVFLPQRDFIRIDAYQSDPDFLLLLLKYRVMVLTHDAATSSLFSSQETEVVQSLFEALETGVNTWVAMRIPMGTFAQGADPGYAPASLRYQRCFGVQRMRYPGWTFFARRADPQVRMEDFVGATSQDNSRWPHLVVDSLLLHRRYQWTEPYYHWVDSLAALPAVGYCDLVPEAEVLYTYSSSYGSEHFLGVEHSYEGLPVMHRLDNGNTRTVHSLFTPLAFEDSSVQLLVERVLNWLCCGEEP